MRQSPEVLEVPEVKDVRRKLTGMALVEALGELSPGA